MKDELGRKIMREFPTFRATTYRYLTDNNDEDKKQRAQKNVPLIENLNLKIINIV